MQQNIPPLKSAYISAVTATSCTISGPPSTIDALRSSPALRQHRLIPLYLVSPFHGSHLPVLSTCDFLYQLDRKGSASQLQVQIPILSSNTGLPVEGRTFRALVPGMVEDIFQNRIQENVMIQACSQGLDRERGASFVSIVAPGLQRRFEAGLANLNVSLQAATSSSIPSTRPTASSAPQDKSNETGVAIVGMSGRFPSAESLDEFWKVLEDGVDLCREIPADRFDIQLHHDSSGKKPNTTLSPYGCFLDKPGMFDARLFNMSPREAASTDPGQRLLLMSTYEALEMAGYTQYTDAAGRDTKVGTFFGQTIDDWREYNAAENVDMYYVTGGIRAFSAGRVNYHFKWDGPSYSVDSACSSSLLAIQLAYNSLRAGECNMAVAGGSNILTGCNMYAGLSRGSFLSTTGPCKTFDSGADGYCRGEGVGVVVLKRLSDAVANRDPILAVIKSAATNHSAQAVSITHPHVKTQERLFRDVLGQAGVVDPAEVDYVECHGTGTQAGDGAESHSVVNVFCKTPRQRPLVIGSIKPNIGHGEAAAGVSSLIKTILMLQHDRILPHIGVKGELNPKLPPFLDNYEIATSSKFPRPPGKTRKLMINNFSAAGGNTSIFLEDKPSIADAPPADVFDPRDVHIVTISAKSSASLRGNVERFQQYLAKKSFSDKPQLADIAYTSTARRLHHPLREAYAVKSVSELSAALEKSCASWDSKQTAAAPATPSVAFSFPGQGQGVMGVAKELHETSPSFRRILDELDALCTSQGLPSIVKPLSDTLTTGLSAVESQLCLALLEVALARLWKSWGVKPSLVVGHSLGEYASLYVAGVLSAADLVFLVGKRATLMQELCTRGTHKMVSLRMSAEDVRLALTKAASSGASSSLEITCVNGPHSAVVAGCASDIESFVAQQQALGVSAVLLNVPYSFHSAQMDPILEAYETDASRVQFAAPKIPVASSLLGSVIEQEGVFDSSYLSRHAREPVLFSQAVNAAHNERKTDDSTIWLEMGPGMVCTSLVKQSLGSSASTTLPTLDTKKGVWQSISATLANLYARGVDINWTEFHRDYKLALSVVNLPHYAFDLKNYWLGYTSRNDPVAPAKEAVPEPKYTFKSPCWQQIEDESFSASEAFVKFTSDLHQPGLAAMVHGHAVGGISLCPSSVYGSIAFSCSSYIFKRRDTALDTASDVPPMALSDMEIFSPCVVTRDSSQRHLLQVTATQASPDSPVELIFSSSSFHDDDSVDEAGSYREHARCIVYLTSKAESFSDATKNLYLIQDRVEMLRRREREGDVDKLRKKMVYKLFRAVVDYEARYHTLDDVLLNSDRPEACARLSFDTPAEPENFVHNPFWIDSLAQLGGFSLNVSPPSGEDDVYISHGWQSMRILRRLSAQEQYLSYVCMQPSENEVGLWSGDMYVYNEQGTVVAMIVGLKFKQMKRTLLYHLLGHALPSSASSSVSSSPSRPSLSRSSSMPLPKDHTNNSPSRHCRTISVDTGSRSRASRHSSPARRTRSRSNLPAAVHRLRSSTSVSSSSRFSDADSAIDVCSGPSPSGSGIADPYDHLLSIIAREVGVGREEILPWTKFSDIGMDSLLTITVLATFREEGGLNLPSSFFNDHPTPKDMEAGLPSSKGGSSKANSEFLSIDELEYLDEEPVDMIPSPQEQLVYESKPILIQGTPTPNGQALFLLPDGSGSALSYVNLPALTPPTASSLPVYALNSPYVSSPDIFLQGPQSSCFEQFAEDLVRTIRSLQPHGPYLIAGWSMGGIFAYEAARQLLAAGETVELLGFIDSPCPGTLPPLPAPTLDVLDKAGLLCGMDGRGVSETTRKHFLASVRALGGYSPRPLPTAKLGKIVAIWARDSLLVNETDEKKRQALLTSEEIAGEARDWLLGKRKSFGAAGWDRLVGKEVLATSIAGNHFSIMSPPLVSDSPLRLCVSLI